MLYDLQEMKEIGKDEVGVTYFACDYSEGVLSNLPWEDEQFDCLFFPALPVDEPAYTSAIEEILKKNIDWVFTCEPDSERWHDVVDKMAVVLGCQQEIGDGSPMTAWFDEVKKIEDWDAAYNHGGSDYFLFVFISAEDSLESRVERLRSRLKADQDGRINSVPLRSTS
ncbi:MAG: hypothetical protein CML13_17050 [Puniceicoccaceae bacterium]|mgnify:FL=1|nr:hypothetical protein [Puniceicoccaceae bacterium]